MNLPFTVEQFLQVFRDFNTSIWPMQIVAYVLAVGALALCLWRVSYGDRVVAGVLAFFWLFMGAVYHIGFFSRINNAAYIFGALFIVQGLLFAFVGSYRNRLIFGFRANIHTSIGAAFVLYSMVVYPLIGAAVGHAWPNSPSFGVAPCPGTIFTFGMLLLTASRLPKYLLVIPALWSLIGFAAALTLGITEDIGLLVAGVLGTALIIVRDRKTPAEKEEYMKETEAPASSSEAGKQAPPL